jgi:hypothetical protein
MNDVQGRVLEESWNDIGGLSLPPSQAWRESDISDGEHVLSLQRLREKGIEQHLFIFKAGV